MFFISITDTSSYCCKHMIFVSMLIVAAAYCHLTRYEFIYNLKDYFFTFCFIYWTGLCINLNKRKWQTWKQGENYANLVYVNLLFISVTFGVVARIILRNKNTAHSNPNHSHLGLIDTNPLFSIYKGVFVSTVLAVIPELIAHQEIIAYKDEIIATKASYQRYISHELRSPFNAAQMGIDYCLAKIPDSTINIDMKGIRDTLVEVNRACKDGLEILNDLLLYDKLENGHVKLQKEDIHIKTFIVDYLKNSGIIK